MEKPTYQQVFEEFKKKLGDENVAHMCAKKFVIYNDNNADSSGAWTVKKSKKVREPMTNWHLAVNTFIRNISRYNKDIMVRIQRNKIFSNPC